MSKYWTKAGKEVVFKPEIILSTFSKKELKMLNDFNSAFSLKKRGLRESEIVRKLNIPRGRVSAWFRGRKPNSVKILEIVEQKDWLPLSTSDKKFVAILDVFTWIFGDGHLNIKNASNIFLFGQKEDLEKIKPKIEDLGLISEITEDPGPGNSSPDTCRLTIRGNSDLVKLSFGKLLVALGVPAGNKVKSNFLIPNWVFQVKPELKKRFLEVFLSNEATIRGLEGKEWLPQLDIRMRKMGSNVGNLINFLNQIRTLLGEFGVNASPAKIQSRLVDKHGSKCVAVLNIPKSIINIFNFSHNFELVFAEKKQNVLDTLKVATEEKIRKHINDIENFVIANEFRKQGIGARRVAKLINKNVNTVIGWFHQNNKPIFWGREMELKKLLSGMYVRTINNSGDINYNHRISHIDRWRYFGDN